MKTTPLTPATENLARRLVWFEEPAEALREPVRFVAYAFARATHEDMRILRDFMTDDDLLEALHHAPPGIIDARSWAFWNAGIRRHHALPMPIRRFE